MNIWSNRLSIINVRLKESSEIFFPDFFHQNLCGTYLCTITVAFVTLRDTKKGIIVEAILDYGIHGI